MNAATTKVSGLYPWSGDLEGSRDVSSHEKPHYGMLLGWMEKFVCSRGLQPGRAACERFWREGVMARSREAWQIEQWGAAIRWYLRWLFFCGQTGGGSSQRLAAAASRRGGRVCQRDPPGGG